MNPSDATGMAIGNWQILAKLGDGSFGSVYFAQRTSQQEGTTQQAAIKTEAITNVKQMLLLEYKVYQEMEGERGFPLAIEYEEEETFSYMAMERLETTLDKYATQIFRDQFVPKDVLLLVMRETLQIIQKLHQKGYLYRDVKPANFMLRKPYDQIYAIDFGLCKKYLLNGRHIPNKAGKKLVGTPLFCSLNTHAGIEQSRRDDLQSWLIMALYLSTKLPWESIISRKDLSKEQQYEQIFQIKQKTSWEELVKQSQKAGSKTEIPSCLPKLINYIRELQFEQEPNYAFIGQLIADQYKKCVGSPIDSARLTWQSQLNGEMKQTRMSPVKRIGKINFKVPKKTKEVKLLQSLSPELKENIQVCK